MKKIHISQSKCEKEEGIINKPMLIKNFHIFCKALCSLINYHKELEGYAVNKEPQLFPKSNIWLANCQ